jgi:hypothetical protein
MHSIQHSYRRVSLREQSGGLGHGDKTLEKCNKVKVPQDQSIGLGHGDKTLEKCFKVKVPQDQSGGL